MFESWNGQDTFMLIVFTIMYGGFYAERLYLRRKGRIDRIIE